MQLQESTWTDHRTAELQKFFDLGLSCSHIGKRIGVTRNAVIGKLHRMGLSRPRDPVKKKAAKAPRSYSRIGNTIFKAKNRPILARVHEAVERSPKNKTFFDLEQGECKWPLGDETPYLFCAHDAEEGLPYCSFHWRMGHTYTPKKSATDNRAHALLRNNHTIRSALEASRDREDGAGV